LHCWRSYLRAACWLRGSTTTMGTVTGSLGIHNLRFFYSVYSTFFLLSFLVFFRFLYKTSGIKLIRLWRYLFAYKSLLSIQCLQYGNSVFETDFRSCSGNTMWLQLPHRRLYLSNTCVQHIWINKNIYDIN
jgi:hypothetical protein